MHRAYTYISSKAACDPAKTIYVCAPEQFVVSEEAAEQFAVESGWQAIAEEQEAVLVLPVAEQGWTAEPTSLLLDYYNETKNSFKSRSGSAIWGRTGSLWCWETVLYIVGYQEGAEFAGNVLVNYPNFAAAAALVGGLPTDYFSGDARSNHWMVREVSEDYSVKNREIPVCLWLFDVDQSAAKETMEYFSQANLAEGSELEQVGGVDTIVRRSKINPAQQVRLVTGDFATEKQRSNYIFDQMISHRIRWKNGPDGTLAFLDSKEEFYSDPQFCRHSVELDGVSYDYFVHIPNKDGARQDNALLPVVFTVHGRGEPAWMFTRKNGWDTLADETGEFILVSPDSRGNIWFILRDGDVFEKIVDQLDAQYHIDRMRIYLTGFSNGAVMTREMAFYRPDLFAAISPSNGPWFDTTSMQRIDASKAPAELSEEVRSLMQRFEEEGWEMPCAFFYGDSDPAAKAEQDLTLPLMLKVNGCGDKPTTTYTKDNYFTFANGYQEGDRFSSAVYCSPDHVARVCVTVMKNIPHGAIAEESRFSWNFLKHFRRPDGSKQVEYQAN